MRSLRHSSLFVCLFVVVAGCGRGGPELHPVSGQVRFAAGDVRPLEGHVVEAALDGDPFVRGYGAIDAEGRFDLETLFDGAVRQGVPRGRYRVRLVLSDDDEERRRAAVALIPARLLDLATTDLTFEAPAPEGVTLVVAGP